MQKDQIIEINFLSDEEEEIQKAKYNEDLCEAVKYGGGLCELRISSPCKYRQQIYKDLYMVDFSGKSQGKKGCIECYNYICPENLELMRCVRCGCAFRKDEMIYDPDINIVETYSKRRLCGICYFIEIKLNKVYRRCCSCNLEMVIYSSHGRLFDNYNVNWTFNSLKYDMCKYCIGKIKKSSIKTVNRNNSRARKLGCQATLTYQQWEETLEYFDNKCAYCLDGPYECLEHVNPLTRGGGTTFDNCVPACASCNARKNNNSLSDLGHLFLEENLIDIFKYLEGIRLNAC